MIYLDSETCGLHGMPVILQYARDNGPIQIHEFWRCPIIDTINLLEEIAKDCVCGFNLSYDWFHISKIFTTFYSFPDWSQYPDEHIDEIGILEEKARFLDICLKPKSALDLMLIARRGPYQSLMPRDDIKIKRVPNALAAPLADELERRIALDPIYFSKDKTAKAHGNRRWRIYDITDSDGKTNPNFKNVVLKFKSSASLKALAHHALKIPADQILLFSDIELDETFRPNEYGYAPFAKALCPDFEQTRRWFTIINGKSYRAWPFQIKEHIWHWSRNEQARSYANNDIEYTRELRHFFGDPEGGDNDSVLACMVGSCRWRGFAIDPVKLKLERDAAEERRLKVPTAPEKVKIYLTQVLSPVELLGAGLEKGTKKTILEEIEKFTLECPCSEDDLPDPKCEKCSGTGKIPHPAAQRAKEVLASRKAKKRIEIIDKLLLAGRLHPDYVVVGTLSNRMSGTGGLNVTGIDHSNEIRECFTFADVDNPNETYCGGDFDAFEVTLAAVVFDDDKLNVALKSGYKIHAGFAVRLFPGKTYEEILKTKGKDPDLYDKGKKGIFSIFYGGDENTHKNRLGVDLEVAAKAVRWLETEYNGIGRFGKFCLDHFGALRQPRGLGTKVEWHNPDPYAESFLGFRRYFTLENQNL
jgi:hypothetical protein